MAWKRKSNGLPIKFLLKMLSLTCSYVITCLLTSLTGNYTFSYPSHESRGVSVPEVKIIDLGPISLIF